MNVEDTFLGELEKAIREIAPVQKYGYIDYFLSDSVKIVLGKNHVPYLSGDFSLGKGYNCCDIATFLSKALSHYGMDNSLVFGKDSHGIFGEHFYCMRDEKVLDATPLYPFMDARHPAPMGAVASYDMAGHRFCENPLAVYEYDGKSHILLFSKGSVLRGGVYLDFFEDGNSGMPGMFLGKDSDAFNFTLSDLCLGNGSSKELISTDAYSFDASVYRKRFRKDAAPLDFCRIPELIDDRMLTRIDVTERHYLSFSYGSSALDPVFEHVHAIYPVFLGSILHKLAYAEISDLELVRSDLRLFRRDVLRDTVRDTLHE